MYKTLILLFLAAAHCQNADNGNGDDIVSKIFGKEPNKNDKSGGQTVATQTPESSSIVPPTTSNPTVYQDMSCTRTDESVGECVSESLCNKPDTTIYQIDGIDLHFVYNPCENYKDTCCRVEDKRPVQNPVPQTTEPKRKGCGWRNPNGVDFHTTGEAGDGETKFGEFPWMVAIFRLENSSNNHVYIAGGSLIHPSAVLTSAHYVNTPGAYKVRAGEWDTQNEREIYPHQERNATSVAIHEDFNKRNLYYSVALLFLEHPMDLAPNVGVACLPTPKKETPAGTRCFATGWDKNIFGKDGLYQVIMKKVELPVVDRTTCLKALRRTRLGEKFELHSSFMCAGGEVGKNTCQGDGGSPLSCPIDYEENRYVQSGIVAWGIGCGQNGIPGVFVDVAKCRDWIDDKIAGKGYNPNTYSYDAI